MSSSVVIGEALGCSRCFRSLFGFVLRWEFLAGRCFVALLPIGSLLLVVLPWCRGAVVPWLYWSTSVGSFGLFRLGFKSLCLDIWFPVFDSLCDYHWAFDSNNSVNIRFVWCLSFLLLFPLSNNYVTGLQRVLLRPVLFIVVSLNSQFLYSLSLPLTVSSFGDVSIGKWSNLVLTIRFISSS